MSQSSDRLDSAYDNNFPNQKRLFMPRHKRFHQDWAIYHVIIRCNNKQMFLSQAETKMLLLESFAIFQKRLDFKMYGFVVMDNHAHWLMQVQGLNSLSTVMQKVLLSFSRKYRQRNVYVGHFWQGRYKSHSVISDAGMQEVLKYIHENPVKAKMVEVAKDYVYSSAYKYFNFSNSKIEQLIEISKYGDTSVGSLELIRV